MIRHGRTQRRALAWSWWRIAPLDAAIAWSIVLVCLALCLQRVPPFLTKLMLMEAMTHLPSQTRPLVEALALTGGLDTLAPAEPQPLARFRYGLQEGQAVAALSRREGEPEVRLGMRLAVQEPGLAWHTLPLCGLREPPAGWRSQAVALASGLTDQELPFACSNR